MPVGVALGLGSALVAALVTEIYCHRALAHRAFRVHPVLGSALTTYFCVFVGTDPETWAAVHRLHHRYADTPPDPHSPRLRPPVTVLAGSAVLFAIAKRRVAAGTSRPPGTLVLRGLAVALLLVAIGPTPVLTILVVHLIGYLGIMGMVNTVGHLYGRKPHPDSAGYDLAWLAIPLLGHGYHNSHHAHPAAARTGLLDPIWPLLRVMGAAGIIDLGNAAPDHRACCGASASVAVRT